MTAHDYEAASERSEAAQTLAQTILVATLKPKLSKDGNQWVFLYGDNLQEGVAGFGDTVHHALMDFNHNFYNEKVNQ